MKTSHHFLAVLLAVLLCLSLTACGDSSDDVTGDDWRVSGVVAAEGTITHEGEGSVKVLVTVGPESAAFYRDEPEQELFDSVSFPVTVEDANDDGTGFDISFDDITGDGESDVVVTFQHADMSTTQMVWFWDADERYVFEPDYSYFHENGVQTDLTDTPYFSDNGLQINAAVNTGTYLLENGVACYSGLGDGYERNDCYWEVIKHSDQSHDGIRGIQFDAICYIPESSIPYFTEQHITNIAIHEIDICRWLLGENLNEVAVRFPRATCFAEGTCQDPQMVLMQSDSGVLIDVEVSGNSYYGYEILCELVCEKGTIRLPVAAEPIVRSYLQCGQAIPEDWTNRFVVAYQEELQYWVDYLQGKTDVPGPGAEDGYEACKISDALIKAQTTGQWEKVEA